MKIISQLDVNDANDRLKNGAVLVDVRDENEIAEMSCDVDKTICISIDQIENLSSSISKDTEIITVCLSGGRSYLAAQKLAEMGFTNVSNLAGGIFTWKNENLPMK